jgi:hypothetical protein
MWGRLYEVIAIAYSENPVIRHFCSGSLDNRLA